MMSVCFPSFSMNSPSTFWGNGCHRLNRIQSKGSSLSSMLSQRTSKRALGGRTGSKNLLRFPGQPGPSGVPCKVCAGYCPDSLSPNCPLCFSQFEWMFNFFPPPDMVWRVQVAQLAGMGASQAGDHTNTFLGVGCGQCWMDTSYSASRRQVRPHGDLHCQRNV